MVVYSTVPHIVIHWHNTLLTIRHITNHTHLDQHNNTLSINTAEDYSHPLLGYAEGTPEGKGLYYNLYPESSPNTDSVSLL